MAAESGGVGNLIREKSLIKARGAPPLVCAARAARRASLNSHTNDDDQRADALKAFAFFCAQIEPYAMRIFCPARTSQLCAEDLSLLIKLVQFISSAFQRTDSKTTQHVLRAEID